MKEANEGKEEGEPKKKIRLNSKITFPRSESIAAFYPLLKNYLDEGWESNRERLTGLGDPLLLPFAAPHRRRRRHLSFLDPILFSRSSLVGIV